MKQNLVDVAEFVVQGGKGGRGAISWRREKFVPKGGPAGGDGGKGGSVRVVATDSVKTLRNYAGKDRYIAWSGEGGGKNQRHGEDAPDLVLKVPAGTVVKVKTSDYRLLKGRPFYGEDIDNPPEGGVVHSGMKMDSVPYRDFGERWSSFTTTASARLPIRPFAEPVVSEDEVEWFQVADLDTVGQELVVAYGGRGGFGNVHYKSSVRTTPRLAQEGELGERFMVRLEMKVLADVGLVGMPNVGKSTLLSVLTAAKPEIANYPFTTLSPNLGVLRLAQDKALVIADIPGLIEDAHQGKGLGVDFLRHVERCKALVYVLAPDVMGDLEKQYEMVKKEVTQYSPELMKKPSLVIVNKKELLDKPVGMINNQPVLMVSAATHKGLEELKTEISKLTGR